MPILAYRAKQSTNTTGTGTLVLNAAETNARSFNAAFGASSRRILYMIQFATGYEFGLGDFDGGSPGNLTRATVLASSNANALVTLAAGTKDVFAVFDPAAREVISISATATLALADLGNSVVFSGASAATLNLPAIATVPTGSGWMIRNAGTAALTIDPNGAETINGTATLVLQAGQAAFIFDGGAAWECIIAGGTAAGLSLLSTTRVISAPEVLATSTASASATLDISGVFDDALYARYELEILSLVPATNDVSLALRVGTGAGPTWQAGAAAYETNATWQNNTASAFLGGGGSGLFLTATGASNAVGNQSGSSVSGIIELTNPSSAIVPLFNFRMRYLRPTGNGGAAVFGGGFYGTSGAITGLRLLFSSGNITSGSVRLIGYRK
jgi:hypothetical protein